MSANLPDYHPLVTGLSRQLLAKFAPEEIDMFDEWAEEFYKNPIPPEINGQSSDDPLSFGLNEILLAVTPAILAMATAVVKFICDQAFQSLKDKSSELIRSEVEKLFNKTDPRDKTDDSSLIKFTSEELRILRHIAIQEAKVYGIQANQAELMADGLLQPLFLRGATDRSSK
jgi:hypothetical protein